MRRSESSSARCSMPSTAARRAPSRIFTLHDLRAHFNEGMGEDLAADDVRELMRAARAVGGEEGGSVGAGEEQLDFAAFERLYAAMCRGGGSGGDGDGDGDGDDGSAEAT